jgi:myo-inositol-1(or 4)-monophosphatase
LDPLDGTTNYIHRFPAFAVSLGLQAGGHLEVGVVDVPMMGEVYSATRDGGAFVNGRKISVSGTMELKNAFLATGFISENEENLEEQLRVFSNMVRKARAIRRAGAAAYDLCLVAKGVFDGYWEKGIKPWDSAAGVLLVREAGGVVQTYRGLEYDPFHNSIVAGTKHVVKAVQGELTPYILPSTN